MPTFDELLTFFQQWQETQFLQNNKKQPPATIKYSSWKSFFTIFAQALHASSASGNHVDIFGIDEIGRHELRAGMAAQQYRRSRAGASLFQCFS